MKYDWLIKSRTLSSRWGVGVGVDSSACSWAATARPWARVPFPHVFTRNWKGGTEGTRTRPHSSVSWVGAYKEARRRASGRLISPGQKQSTRRSWSEMDAKPNPSHTVFVEVRPRRHHIMTTLDWMVEWIRIQYSVFFPRRWRRIWLG
jgi:hypothetical protein